MSELSHKYRDTNICIYSILDKNPDDPRFIDERNRRQNRLARVKAHCMTRARRQEGLLQELFGITPAEYDARFAHHERMQQEDDQEVINLFQGSQGQSQGGAQAQAAAPEPPPPPPPAPIEEETGTVR